MNFTVSPDFMLTSRSISTGRVTWFLVLIRDVEERPRRITFALDFFTLRVMGKG
jgi:hypothetical protein